MSVTAAVARRRRRDKGLFFIPAQRGDPWLRLKEDRRKKTRDDRKNRNLLLFVFLSFSQLFGLK